MDRRQYLALVAALGVGPLAGCETTEVAGSGDGTPRDRPTSDGPASETADGGGSVTDGGDGTDGGRANYQPDAETVDLGDRFVLEDREIRFLVSGTERRESMNRWGTSTATDGDLYIVRMTVQNRSEDEATIENELFWLEGLPPDDNHPDPDVTADLPNGMSGGSLRLTPGGSETLEIGFTIPNQFEPVYLWVDQFYVCLR